MKNAAIPGVVVGLLACFTARVTAQSSVERIIAAARAQVVDLNGDSAAVLLRIVLDARSSPTRAERTSALVLLGVTELLARRPERAREDFRQALALDADVRVDTLGDLHSDLVVTFEAERAQLFRLSAVVSSDTLVLVRDGGLPVRARASRTGWLFLSIEAGGTTAVFRDSAFVRAETTLVWRWAQTPPEAGTYDIVLDARDITGAMATPIRRTVRVERQPVDTAPVPSPLAQSAFAAETASVRDRQPGALLRGLAFGIATAGASSLGPGSDRRGYVLAGAFTLGGLVGFLSGPVATRPIQKNITRNLELRDENARRRAAALEANALARANARLRISLIEDVR
jgi:hypothetical protein